VAEAFISLFESWGWPQWLHWLGYLSAAFIQVNLLMLVIAVGALIFIWAERKVSGRIQDRLGPTRTGGAFGWLQTLADGVKLLSKEDVMPKDADPLLFKIAPYISLAAALAAYMAIPFSNGWVALHLHVGVFFVIAVLGLEVFGVILAGYGSGSKWSLFGAMREAAQVVSYEVPLGLCVIIPVFVAGTMDLVAIANMQAGLFTNWLIFHDPFTFVTFWIFFTCGLASVNRAPFDLAEAESELVAGFHTEYSGMRWSIFFMAEYGSMFTISALAVLLFFGGWNGPIPIFQMAGWAYEQGDSWAFTGMIANLFGLLNFLLKTVFFVVIMMWVRWTLPRLRIDQVITTCLKYCVPIVSVCFVGALAWTAAGWPSVNDFAPPEGHRGNIREGWVVEQQQRKKAAEEEAATAEDESAEPVAQRAKPTDAISRSSLQATDEQPVAQGEEGDGL